MFSSKLSNRELIEGFLPSCRRIDSPPVSMPFLIPLPTDRLTASITSLVPSTTDLEAYGDVEKGRVRSNGSALVGRVLRSDMVSLVSV